MDGLTGKHSPNGKLWLSGSGWVPAWSPDGHYWYDGNQWVARTKPRSPFAPTRNEVVAAIVPFTLLILTCMWSSAVLKHMDAAGNLTRPLSHMLVTFAVILASGWALTLTVAGILLGWRRRWGVAVIFALYVWGLLLVAYAQAMLSAPGPDQDTTAGAGAVVIGIPALAAILVATGTTFLVGLIARLATDAQRRHQLPATT
jgi:hypothetical protein